MIKAHHQSLDSNKWNMRTFRELQDTLKEGDQLWIYHKRTLMKSYAHVVIIVSGNNFIHVNSTGVWSNIRSRAMICKDSFQKLLENDDLCFVVPPEDPVGQETSIFGERAEVCEGICLDYDAESANCETFANAVHGIWGKGVQAPQGGVQKGVKLFNKTAKWTKRNQIPLVYQMWHRIRK